MTAQMMPRVQVRMVDAGMSKSSVLATADRTSGYGESSSSSTALGEGLLNLNMSVGAHRIQEHLSRRGSGRRIRLLQCYPSTLREKRLLSAQQDRVIADLPSLHTASQ